MHTRKSRAIFFTLEGLNTLATSYFGGYIYFLLRDRFGFGNLGNLSAAALGGFVYVFAAWQGGRFAQRFGYFTAHEDRLRRIGCLHGDRRDFSLVAGGPAGDRRLVGNGVLHLAHARSAGQRRRGGWRPTEEHRPLQRRLVGGDGGDVFCGRHALRNTGARQHLLVAGARPRRPIPDRPAARQEPRPSGTLGEARGSAASAGRRPPPAGPSARKTFLRMVWLAIPCSYIGITTITAIIPALAKTLGLSTAEAGLFCSIWMFVRLGTFAALWQWTGWHYRFRWLLAAFVGLMAGFSLLLLSHNLGLLVGAQAVFGVSVGLIYYSSLFYSMDVGESKGEHGGLHEAMIGSGICLGPAVGALSLCLRPAARTPAPIRSPRCWPAGWPA